MSETEAETLKTFAQVPVGSFFYVDAQRYVRIPPLTTALGQTVNTVNITHRAANHLFREFADDHQVDEIEPREIAANTLMHSS
jgi:hypothetical protein